MASSSQPRRGSSSYLLFVFFMLSALTVIGQTKPVSGRVTDENGGPLANASVFQKGTGTGTYTDAKGSFSLQVPENTTLVVSFIGYEPQEIGTSTGGPITVTLKPLAGAMQDVVVIGYGTQKRSDRTGAASTIKGDILAAAPVGSFDAALQGRAPGLQVSQASGSPGSPVRIQIRGTSSVSSGTEPLYVVDGMIIFQDIGGTFGLNPLANINPNDIENVEVLKDAAATAIYGSRGANGVILITTKTGRKGQGRTTFDVNRGFTSAINLLEYTSGQQWLEMVDKARANSVNYGIAANQVAFDPLTLSSNTLPVPAGIAGPQFGPNTAWTRALANQTNTNWSDLLLRDGNITDINFSTSAGFDKGGFFISGQMRDEQGIVTNHSLRRYAVRSNLDYYPNDKIRTGAKFTFSYLDSDVPQLGTGGNGGNVGRGNTGASGGWGQVHSGALPIMPVYNSDGTYFDPLRGRNVVAGNDAANYRNNEMQNRFIGNVFAQFFFRPELSLRTEASADFINSNLIRWTSDVIRYNRRGDEAGRYIQNYIGTAYLNYNKNLTADHNIDVTLGTEGQFTRQRRQDYAYEGLLGSQQEIGEIGNGQAQFITAVSGIFGDRKFVSYFGRANYKYQGRYLLGVSYRRDGSTAFGPENRWGDFPAVSAGWIISREGFAEKSAVLSHFSFLKLRASYGQTGNANIPSFAFLNNYVNWPVYGQAASLGFSVLSNPNIGWEKNNQVDVGLDFGLLNNSLRGTIGYFNRVSQDMILNVPVAPNVGIGPGNQSVITNIGQLRNHGLEIELNTTNLTTPSGFRWTTDFNVTFLRNKVTDLTPQFKLLPTGSNPVAIGIMSGVSITQVDGQLGTYYLAEYAGLDGEGFETIYEIDKTVLTQNGQTVKTGNVIRATQQNINNNRIVLDGKQSLPTWFGGLSNTFSFRGFEITGLITFSGGNYIYDGVEENNSYVRTGSNVILASVYNNTWEAGKAGAQYPKLTWNMRDNFNNATTNQPAPQTLGSRTTRFLHSGDFVRLKTVQLAYNLPANIVSKLRMQNMRLYISGNNLFTITDYPGFDPEYANLTTNNQDRNLSQGFISGAPVPQIRTTNVGISVTF